MAKKQLLRQHMSVVSLAQRGFDLAVVLVVGLLVYYLVFGVWDLKPVYRAGLLFSVLLSAVVLPRFGLYRAWRGRSPKNELRAVIQAFLLIAALLALASVATKTSSQFSRVWFAAWMSGNVALIATSRLFERSVLHWLRRQGRNLRSVVVLGAGEHGQRVVQQLQQESWTGLRVVGFFSRDAGLIGQTVLGLPVLGALADLPDYAKTHGIDQIWLALPLNEAGALEGIMAVLGDMTADIRLVPDLYGLRLVNHSVSEVAGMPVLDLAATPMAGAARVIKSVEDHLLALLFLLLASPLMALIALGVKLSSPGPVFYRQARMGWNGRHFDILKFRTMAADSEQGGVQWGGAAEKRVTRFGAFLRKTSLDELPQFLNVLRGEMSIVGPRPERPQFVEKFKDEIPGYMKKHMVKAGITGWAQVNGWRGDTDLTRRIEHDLWYINHWSLWLDIRILLLTLRFGLIHKNAC
ncbi:MAG: undecaprenyl-phosphate glucose phosphotransferase [Gammaproteobacteria bacterium]|nr:undecaprenyl-phosphate glucose phosphotransferase [Gammaproteobacteria bacterium]